MEAAAATEMFPRFVAQYNLRYNTIRVVGDGDTHTYKIVLASKPYGDDISIEKIGCVGHVRKRTGTRLRKLRTDTKAADGNILRGKGTLRSRNG